MAANALLQEILHQPIEEQAAIAEAILENLAGYKMDDSLKQWEPLINSRIDDYSAGKARLLSKEEFFADK